MVNHRFGSFKGWNRMSKDLKTAAQVVEQNSEKLAFEMIELSIAGVDGLTRAFDVINQVCQERNNPAALIDNVMSEQLPPKPLIN